MILFLTSITFSLFHEYLILAIHSLILNFSTNLLYLTLLSSQSLIILSTLLTFVLIFYSISLPHPSFAMMLQCLLSIVYRFIIIIFEQLYFYIILSILIYLFFWLAMHLFLLMIGSLDIKFNLLFFMLFLVLMIIILLFIILILIAIP